MNKYEKLRFRGIHTPALICLAALISRSPQGSNSKDSLMQFEISTISKNKKNCMGFLYILN